MKEIMKNERERELKKMGIQVQPKPYKPVKKTYDNSLSDFISIEQRPAPMKKKIIEPSPDRAFVNIQEQFGGVSSVQSKIVPKKKQAVIV